MNLIFNSFTMAFNYKSLSLSKVAVIGAGQIGPDICLHFSKVFWKDGVQLVLVDISEEALAKARGRMERRQGLVGHVGDNVIPLIGYFIFG